MTPAVSQYMPGQTLSVAGCYYSYPPKGEIPFPGTTWRIGQEIKTPPFHGGNTGSIPVCVTSPKGQHYSSFFLAWRGFRL